MAEPEATTGEAQYATAALVGPLQLAIAALGGDVEAALRAADLTAADLQDPEARIPTRKGLRLFEAAVDQIGEDFGVRVCKLYVPGTFAVLDYLAHSSATLGLALERMIRFEAIHQNSMRSRLRTQDGLAHLEQVYSLEGERPAALAENSLGTLVAIGRSLTANSWSPRRVTFLHGPPADPAFVEGFFGCPVEYGAAVDSLVLEQAHLQLPTVRANPTLATTLETHAQGLLSRIAENDDLAARTSAAIVVLLPDGTPTVDAIARKLATSGRTLQRRLGEEGTSVAELLDRVRVQLADRYLEDASMGTEDIALLLGFSDARAFRRAFKRWHGTTPAAHRKRA